MAASPPPDDAGSVAPDSPFAHLVAHWRAGQVYRATSAVKIDDDLRNHVLPGFGHLAVGEIRPSHVQAWVRQLSERLAPSTVDALFWTLNSVFRVALDDGLIERNPCSGVRRPRLERAPIVPPTVEEVEALVAATPERYRAIVVLAAGTGLRQGECLGLGLDRVDFERRVVTVDRQLVLVRGQPPRLGPPKTPASYRRVPLPDTVAASLRDHLAAWPLGPDGLIFTDRHGQPFRRHRLGDVWRRARTRSGVTRRVRFHDLRHFYASLLIHAGESVKVVQARLGHASATETLDIYAHLWPDDGESTRAAVDGALRNRG